MKSLSCSQSRGWALIAGLLAIAPYIVLIIAALSPDAAPLSDTTRAFGDAGIAFVLAMGTLVVAGAAARRASLRWGSAPLFVGTTLALAGVVALWAIAAVGALVVVRILLLASFTILCVIRAWNRIPSDLYDVPQMEGAARFPVLRLLLPLLVDKLLVVLLLVSLLSWNLCMLGGLLAASGVVMGILRIITLILSIPAIAYLLWRITATREAK